MHRKYSPEGIVASLLFLALIVVMVIQILGRTPMLTGPIWTEELARWLWVWMAFIGIAEVERTDSQLRMGFLADAMPKWVRRAVFTVVDLVYLGIVIHLCWIGYNTVLRTSDNISVTLPTSDALLYASGFVGTFLIIHRILRRLAGRGGALPPSEPHP